MTETTGKKLGDCRKRSCENNVKFDVIMNIQVTAEVEGFSFGHPVWTREWYECHKKPPCYDPIDKFELIGIITDGVLLIPRIRSASRNHLEHRGA